MTASQKAYKQAQAGIKGRLDGHYQHEGVQWMLRRELETLSARGGILADDMGLGKTMQAIATMRGNELPTLIVSIVGTVNQWRDALIEFGGYRPVIINPSFVGILPSGVEVAITTYSSFQRAKPPTCLFNYDWKRIILDEGHTIRNPATKVYKEISKIAVDIKWILSGTPLQNSAKDLETLAYWIGAKKSDPIEDIVKEMVLRRTQEEQAESNPRLALPPLTTSVVKLEFDTPEERKFYQSIEEFYENKTMTNFEAIESLTRCRQVCTNPRLYIESIGKKNSSIGKKRNSEEPPTCPHNSISCTKLKYLINDISSHCQTNQKCLVFCIWTNEMKFIQEELKNLDISSLIYDGKLSRDTKESVLYNFKNTSIPVLIIQINCGSSGLNLQCANKVYITSPNYNPCVELQAIGRAYRKGQSECVTCVRLVMADTVEERCMEIQDRKMRIIMDAMHDDSMVNRLGIFDNEEGDIDIKTIFKAKKKKKTLQPLEQAGVEQADVEQADVENTDITLLDECDEFDALLNELFKDYSDPYAFPEDI